MPTISFPRRTLLKGASAFTIASAFAPLAQLASASSLVMLVEPGNPLSRRFSALGQHHLDIPIHDVSALKRIFTQKVMQAVPIAGLSSWTTFVMVRELALDAGRKVAFEARHDITGHTVHNRVRLGDLARFKTALQTPGRQVPLLEALFSHPRSTLESGLPAHNGALFSWWLPGRRHAGTTSHPPLPSGATLPMLTGMSKMKLSSDDRFDIQDLFSAYSWALDTGDPEAFVACFTPTAVVREEVFEEADTWEGHAGLRALAMHFMGSPRFPGRQHQVTMPQFFPRDGDHVDSRSFAFVTECQAEPPMVLLFTGYYEDEIVRHQGRWLFARRTIRLWDGEILKNFPNKGDYVPRKRPVDLVVKRRSVP